VPGPDLNELGPKFTGALRVLEQTGMRSFSIRWDEPEDDLPVAWVAVALWHFDPVSRRPVAEPTFGSRRVVKMGVAPDPVAAMIDLAGKAIDGGMCTHCGKMTGLEEAFDMPDLLGEIICWYQWDPELEVFRRSCS
jgi:hypothetical protein